MWPRLSIPSPSLPCWASFRQAASALPDARRGRNKQFSVADAAACAFASFFVQDPSFLAFQRRMQDEEARSNCQSLFDIERIPTDNTIRYLLDGCPSEALEWVTYCLLSLDILFEETGRWVQDLYCQSFASAAVDHDGIELAAL